MYSFFFLFFSFWALGLWGCDGFGVAMDLGIPLRECEFVFCSLFFSFLFFFVLFVFLGFGVAMVLMLCDGIVTRRQIRSLFLV